MMKTKTMSINEIQQQMLAGSLSSEQLVNQALAEISAKSDHHAFITLDKENALAQAKYCDQLSAAGKSLGPLHGIVLCVKDNIHVAGLANTAGTPAFKDFIPTEDAEVIKRVKAAGAIIIGKNNLHELAYGITSDNKAFGAVHNAKMPNYISGGSSGGTAVAVALNMANAGLGTDTGGSVRIPAALNGIVGFRPSIGRYPNTGLTTISQTRDTVGPIVNHVADAQLLDAVLSEQSIVDETVELSSLRIGVPKEYFYDNLQGDIAEKTEQLLTTLAEHGVTLVYQDIPEIATLNEQVSFPVVLFETHQQLQTYIKQVDESLSYQDFIEQIADPHVRGLIEAAASGDISQDIYQTVISQARPKLQQAFADYFQKNSLDAVIFPTTPLAASPIEGAEETVLLNGQQVPTFPTYIHNTDPATNAGIPALSIPLSETPQGLPFGIEINGPFDQDQRLLIIGKAIESVINDTNG